MTDRIMVAVSGALGRMGREVVAAVNAEPDLRLVAEVDKGDDLADVLANVKPVALVDFSVPEAVMGNIEAALVARVVPIIGTTGLSPAMSPTSANSADCMTAARSSRRFRHRCGPDDAVARLARKHMPDAEIIEMHHEKSWTRLPARHPRPPR